MSPILDQILQSGTVTTPEGESRKIYAESSRGDGEFLQQVIREVRPKESLEIGLAFGISSLFICDALAEVGADRHTIVDPFQFGLPAAEWAKYTFAGDFLEKGFEGLGLHNLNKAGHGDLIEFHGGFSYEVLPRLVAEGRKFDFAFIDGSHLFDYTLVDVFYIDMMMNPGGVVAFHDALLYPAVRKVCRYVLTNRPYTVFGPRTNGHAGPGLRRKLLLGLPVVSRYVKKYGKPEFLEPDSEFGLPYNNCIALKKERDDLMGDGSRGSRKWDFHREF